MPVHLKEFSKSTEAKIGIGPAAANTSEPTVGGLWGNGKMLEVIQSNFSLLWTIVHGGLDHAIWSMCQDHVNQ